MVVGSLCFAPDGRCEARKRVESDAGQRGSVGHTLELGELIGMWPRSVCVSVYADFVVTIWKGDFRSRFSRRQTCRRFVNHRLILN